MSRFASPASKIGPDSHRTPVSIPLKSEAALTKETRSVHLVVASPEVKEDYIEIPLRDSTPLASDCARCETIGVTRHSVDNKSEIEDLRNKKRVRNYRIVALGARGKRGSVGLAKQLMVSPHLKTTFRFTADTGSWNIRLQALFAICGGIVTVANTTARLWASSVRLHELRLYVPSNSTSVGAADITWIGSTIGAPDFEYVAANPENITSGQCLVARPPKNTSPALWHRNTESFTSGGEILFQLTAFNSRMVVDVTVEWTLCAHLDGVNATLSNTHPLGQAGYFCLDYPTSGVIEPLVLSKLG